MAAEGSSAGEALRAELASMTLLLMIGLHRKGMESGTKAEEESEGGGVLESLLIFLVDPMQSLGLLSAALLAAFNNYVVVLGIGERPFS